MTVQRHAVSLKDGTARPLKAFQRMLGLMAAASPLLKLGLHHMRSNQFWLKQRVTSAACVSALARWREPFWLKRGVILDTGHRRKVVTTDASNKGWGTLCEGKPTFGLWSEEELGLNINCLEMLAVCQAYQFFLPDIRATPCANTLRQHYPWCHQGGLVSKRLCKLVNDLLVWAPKNLCSLKATHVPG